MSHFSIHDEPVEFGDDNWANDDGHDLESFRVRSRRGRPGWLTGLAVVLVVGLLAGALGTVWIRYQVDPSGPQGAAVQVTIPKGSSTAAIASILGKEKVIHAPSLFRYYVKLKGAGPLLAGSYTFHQNEKYDDVIAALEKAPPLAVTRLTIPEGFTVSQIAAKVGTLPGRSASKFMAAVSAGQVRSRYQPAGSTSLEGLLFPATYQVTANEDEVTILSQMVKLFDDTVANLQIDQGAAKLGMTPYQLVVVASIVEREAKLNEDRGPVASVIYNRLHKSIALQVDSVVLYGEQQPDPHKIDIKTATPYNTYKFKGLPPTPIASPGIPSLQAAIAPPVTTYLYWVLIDPGGKQAFASTSAEFAKLRAESKAKGLL
jgi:UPF0755 protein